MLSPMWKRRDKPRRRDAPAPPSRLGLLWARLHRRAPDESAPLPQASPGFSDDRAGALGEGAYVTDGASLYRVEHAYVDSRTGARFLELEDCATFELSVWSADELAARWVRLVAPIDAPELTDAVFAAEFAAALDGVMAGDAEVMTG
jgi:hypothetical protein